MRALSPLALGLALAACAATASAQTVISRTVSEELVETIVTQDARGTVVTRRIMQAPAAAPVTTYNPAPVVYNPAPFYNPAPVVAYDPPAPIYPPAAVTYAPPAYVPPAPAYTYAPPGYAAPVQTVVMPETVDDVTTRQYVRPATRVVTRAPIVARTDARPARRARAVALTPAERRVVYRTIVQQQVIAAPAVRDPYWRPPIVARDDLVAPVAPAAAVYPVGAALPAAAPIYGVPETVAVRVPAARPYSYSYFGGRVYLVDPATGVIVADVTQ